jgi:predicted nucleic acid-binding protein
VFLVDTSVIIGYLKGKESMAVNYFTDNIDSEFYLTPIVYQEVVQGSRDQREFDKLHAYLRSQFFCYSEDMLKTHNAAAKIYFDCRRKGITIRSTIDCLIAQIAIDNKLPLLHDDTDFAKIQAVCSLKFAC